jgi:aspartate aminotransferase-like enzyme
MKRIDLRVTLRVPGPTPCPEPVLRAMAKQMIYHRSEEFGIFMNEVTVKLKRLFQTQGDVLILTTSGYGGLESSVVNFLSPREKVLAICTGVFGESFGDIAEMFGAGVSRLRFEWGYPADPEAVREALAADPRIKAVLVTHNETSTGVTNDLEAISAVVNGFDKLLIVDAISSLGCLDLPVDRWGCDVVVTASEKGLMTAPGLAMVSVSQKAWKAHSKAKMPRCYWDLGRAKEYLERGQTTATPAISILYGLAAALELMENEGLPNIIARHARLGSAVRAGVKALGLSLFAKESCASNTVTAVRAPNGVDVKKLLELVREQGTLLAGGQSRLEGKIFRIGHMGWITETDVEAVIASLRSSLAGIGHFLR